MIGLAQLLAFVPVAILVVAIPGPSVIFAVGRAISVGRGEALRTVVGNGVGLAIQATGVAVGLGVVLSAAAWALGVLRVLGGLYLIWLGVSAIRRRHDGLGAGSLVDRGDPGSPTATGRKPATHKGYVAGLIVGLTNPKTLVFLTALLPQFVVADRGHAGQVMILGLIFAAIAIAGDSLWVVAASRARTWFATSPGRLARLRAAGGVMLVGLGAATLATGRHTSA